jgi:hypothetical protein
MTATDGYIQVTPGGGKKVDTSELTIAGQTVERERLPVSDPEVSTAHAKIQDYLTNLENGLVLRSIYNKEVLNAVNILTNEVRLLRLAMEDVML